MKPAGPWPWQVPTSDALKARMERSVRGRANKRAGDLAEKYIAARLRDLGLWQVERRETGWRIQRARGRVVGATPKEKVSGDFSAVAPGGLYVHVEAKNHLHPDEPLSLSDFDTHQLAALNIYASLAIALVAWMSASRIALLRWPITGFEKGSPLSWDAAAALSLTTAPTLSPKVIAP